MLKPRISQTGKKTCIFLACGLILYGLGKWYLLQNSAPADLTIGSKNFTESKLLGEMYALTLEKNGFHVSRKFNLGGTMIAHAALQKGEIDLYPEYTGTGLITILKLSPVHQPDIRQNPENTLNILNREYAKRWDLRWLTPSLANDSQGLVITSATANQYDLHTISRLAALPNRFILAAIPEFVDREDGLPGLQRTYPQLSFTRVQQYDNGLKYRILLNRNADVTVAFTTDGALTDPRLTLLEDDRHFWPEYRIAPVIRQTILRQYPVIEGILNRLSAQLTTESMRQLNAAVDLKKQDYQTVARHFLKNRRII